MVNAKIIKFRVNSEQYETLKKNASSKGFVSLSSYLRDLAFNQKFVLEKMLFEVHNEIVKRKTE